MGLFLAVLTGGPGWIKGGRQCPRDPADEVVGTRFWFGRVTYKSTCLAQVFVDSNDWQLSEGRALHSQGKAHIPLGL